MRRRWPPAAPAGTPDGGTASRRRPARPARRSPRRARRRAARPCRPARRRTPRSNVGRRRHSAKIWRGQHPGPQRVHAADRVADAHRVERVAVVAAAPGRQPLPARAAEGPLRLQRHLDRHLDPDRAGVAEEDVLQPGRGDLDQRGGQRDAGSWVSPPNITWLIRPACRPAPRPAPGAGSRGSPPTTTTSRRPAPARRPAAAVRPRRSPPGTARCGRASARTGARRAPGRAPAARVRPGHRPRRRPGGHRPRRPADQGRAPVDEAGVELHQRGAGVEHPGRVVGVQDPADPDDRQRAAGLGVDEVDHLAGPLGQRPPGQPAGLGGPRLVGRRRARRGPAWCWWR